MNQITYIKLSMINAGSTQCYFPLDSNFKVSPTVVCQSLTNRNTQLHCGRACGAHGGQLFQTAFPLIFSYLCHKIVLNFPQ